MLIRQINPSGIFYGAYAAVIVFLVTLSLVLLQGRVTFAQTGAATIDMNNLEFLSQRNGLSSNLVTDMVEDRQGYLWIGTQDGLNRYDGYSFRVFKKKANDRTSIQFNTIFRLAVDRKGNVWAGSTDGLISYFDPSTQSFVNFDWSTAGLPGDGVSKIFFDRHDNVWVTVNKHGLFRLDKAQKRFDHIADLPYIHDIFKNGEHYAPAYNTIYDIHEDEFGMFWMATHDGLYMYNPLSRKFTVMREKPIEPFKWRNDCFLRILPAPDGFWLSAYGGGLSFFNFKTKVWKTFKYDLEHPESPTSNIISDLGWRGDEELWLCTLDRGWGVFNIKAGTFYFPQIFYPTSTNVAISDMVIQPSGVVWFSSRLKGIFKYAPKRNSPDFYPVKVKHSDNGESFYTRGFYHDIGQRKLYYGTLLADGVHIRDLKTQKEKILSFETLPGGEPFLEVEQIIERSPESLWVLTRDYIYILDRKKEVLRRFGQPEASASPAYSDIIRGTTGDLWVSSYRNGLFKFDSAGNVQHFVHQQGNPRTIASNTVRTVIEDNDGNIWAATNNGLSIYDPRKRIFMNFSKNEKFGTLISNNLIGLAKTNNGSIWLATSDQGLLRYEATSDSIVFSHWGLDSGIPSEVIHAATTDAHGTLWASTPSALFSISEGGDIRSYFHTSVVLDITSDDEGNLFMASMGGFLQFNQKSVSIEKKAEPKLVINSFKYFDQEVPLVFDSLQTASITLDYDQNFISFDFAALDFTDPSKNTYSYFLEGADKTWIHAGPRHYASYTNLSPATYQFRLKAANPDGVWTEPGITVQVTIVPPFWSTWYFRLFLLVLAGCAVFILHSIRVAKIRERENLKSEYNRQVAEIEMSALRAQMNPHFIFNSLNSINRYILKADPETASLYLTKFSRLIRLILDNSKNSKVILEGEISAITLYIEMELIRFDYKFSYNIECSPSVDLYNTEIPSMIVQPYVENAIWHGLLPKEDHGKLDITFDVKENILICVIEDNGIGRERSMRTRSAMGRRKSYGMQITSSRLDLLRVRSKRESSVEVIDLKDEAGEGIGTRVVVRIPVDIRTRKKNEIAIN